MPAIQTYECKVAIVKEEDGFSAHATDLPGVVSQGDTIEEAVRNIAEAFEGVLGEYLSDGTIPWSEVEIEGDVVCEKRIIVNA